MLSSFTSSWSATSFSSNKRNRGKHGIQKREIREGTKKEKKKTQCDIFLIIRSLRFCYVALWSVLSLHQRQHQPHQHQNQHGRNQHAKKKKKKNVVYFDEDTNVCRRRKNSHQFRMWTGFFVWLATCIAHHLLSLSIPYLFLITAPN